MQKRLIVGRKHEYKVYIAYVTLYIWCSESVRLQIKVRRCSVITRVVV